MSNKVKNKHTQINVDAKVDNMPNILEFDILSDIFVNFQHTCDKNEKEKKKLLESLIIDVCVTAG